MVFAKVVEHHLVGNGSARGSTGRGEDRDGGVVRDVAAAGAQFQLYPHQLDESEGQEEPPVGFSCGGPLNGTVELFSVAGTGEVENVEHSLVGGSPQARGDVFSTLLIVHVHALHGEGFFLPSSKWEDTGLLIREI